MSLHIEFPQGLIPLCDGPDLIHTLTTMCFKINMTFKHLNKEVKLHLDDKWRIDHSALIT